MAAEPAKRLMFYTLATCGGLCLILFNAPLVVAVWATKKCEDKLKALVRRATTWDLDEGDRDELQSFSRLFRKLLWTW